MTFTEEDAENTGFKAHQMLKETAREYAELKVAYEAAERKKKRVLAAIFMFEKGSAEARKQAALASPRYAEVDAEIDEAQLAYEALKTRREAAMASLDFCRSVMATLRSART